MELNNENTGKEHKKIKCQLWCIHSFKCDNHCRKEQENSACVATTKKRKVKLLTYCLSSARFQA